MESTTTIQVDDKSTLRQKYCDMKHDEYCKLIELAELSECELSDCEEDNAEYALSKVLKHGTYGDTASAIKHYAKYLHSGCEMMSL